MNKLRVWFFPVLSFLLITVFQQSSARAASLTIEDRVAYQRAIEEVYWKHRIWPNKTAKPPLDRVKPESAIRSQVENVLRQTNALERYWQRSIASAELQAELDRMIKNTKQPAVLREVFAALGNDPGVIAEMVARPIVTNRLLRNLYAGKAPVQDRSEKDFDDWWEATKVMQSSEIAAPLHAYQMDFSQLANAQDCADDTWQSTSLNFPVAARAGHTSIWTGTEMIVWGGAADGVPVPGGARYNPSTDTWANTNASGEPQARTFHTAVWTGSEMIVWGGFHNLTGQLGTGARYNPSNDAWSPLNSTTVPEARHGHKAVWTGTEMIVWGGTNSQTGLLNTGARYNPSTQSWVATTTTNAPAGRDGFTAVWSGSEMIIWGGYATSTYFANGARYNPNADTWIAIGTVNAPQERGWHTAVWVTGNQMIVWGGVREVNGDTEHLNTGASYFPESNAWVPISTANAPTGRSEHVAVWTGSEMIVWGGANTNFEFTGGRYFLSTNSWASLSVSGLLESRTRHTAVWTGTDMIIWGGGRGSQSLASGARFIPSRHEWVATSLNTAPHERAGHTAVWTGAEMLIWGGQDQNRAGLSHGTQYIPSTDTWTIMSDFNAPEGRWEHTAVWTGIEMIVWGGGNAGGAVRSGGRYNVSTETWSHTNLTNAPIGRTEFPAIWTGSEMIIWGGRPTDITSTDTGGRYNPSNDSWAPMSTNNVPVTRFRHSAVWTGTEMIIWGGFHNSIGDLKTGGRYNPDTDVWIATTETNAPSPRSWHAAIWTGNEMIVWGGSPGSVGGRYMPSNDTWQRMSTTNEPVVRYLPAAVWTGREMIVWGGSKSGGSEATGGRYHLSTDSWTQTSVANAPIARFEHTGIWTGTEMIVWGGATSLGERLNTGARYCATPPATILTQISINDATITEGNAGATNATFTISLSDPTTSTVTVDYGTADDTASAAGNDYSSASGTVTFAANETSKSITVTVHGDATFEANETFLINLTNESNATIADNQGVGTITNDDQPPTASISDATVVEGHSGTSLGTTTVTLSAASGVATTINFSMADNTAVAPSDYIPGAGTLTIPEGSTTGTIAVAVVGDNEIEVNETFYVNLLSAQNATISDGQGIVTIQADDPYLTISDVSRPEGRAGRTNLVFTITRSVAAPFSSTVRYATANQTAIAGSDYIARTGTVTIAAGATSATFTIQAYGDRTREPNETFVVDLSNPVRATIFDAQAVGTIQNDD